MRKFGTTTYDKTEIARELICFYIKLCKKFRINCSEHQVIAARQLKMERLVPHVTHNTPKKLMKLVCFPHIVRLLCLDKALTCVIKLLDDDFPQNLPPLSKNSCCDLITQMFWLNVHIKNISRMICTPHKIQYIKNTL